MDLIAGAVGGCIATICTYPIDTIKTHIQSRQLLTLTPRSLYKGITSPLIGVVLEKAILFEAYQRMNGLQMFNSQSFNAQNSKIVTVQKGIIAGLITTGIVTPFERVKVRAQLSGQPSIPTLKAIVVNDGLSSLYRGWTATLFREVPGYGVYFGTYEYCKRRWPDRTYKNMFISGMLTGGSAWAVIYPSDPIKTIMQHHNIPFKKSIKKIYAEQGLFGFYRGFKYALVRASLFHGFVITGYEITDRLKL